MVRAFDYTRCSLKRDGTLEAQPQHTGTRTEPASSYHTDAFRLLKLHPGLQQSDLECSLLTRRLAHSQSQHFQLPEKYEALSYNWGPRLPRKTIRIIQGEDVFEVEIRPNLDAALRLLRRQSEVVYLWVDALCIDQADAEEKGVQIPLMRFIYNQADCVRIWLGVEGNGSSSAMEFVEQCLDLTNFDDLVTNAAAAPHWADLSALMRRPWFNRRWIIQEVALAKRAIVHCGDKSISWRKFASVIKMLSRAGPQLRKLFRESVSYKNNPDFLGHLSELGAIRLADLADNLFRKMLDGTITGKHFSLEALMASLTAFETSEPRDVLYAILWLAHDAHAVPKTAYTVPENMLTVPIRDGPSGEPSPVQLSFDDVGLPLSRTASNDTIEPFPQLENTSFNSPNTARPGVSPGIARQTYAAVAAAAANRIDDAQITSQQMPNIRLNDNDMLDSPNTSASLAHSRIIAPTSAPMPLTLQIDASIPTKLEGRARQPSFSKGQSLLDKTRIALRMFHESLEHSRIFVDYEKDIFEVYKDFLKLSLRQSRSIDILCIPWAPEDPSLPSWIPQLTGMAFSETNAGIHRRVHADPLVKRPGYMARGPKPYDAARGRLSEYHFGGLNETSLFVRGFVLDRISHTERSANEGIIPAAWMTAGGWHDHGDPPPEIFWRTLVGNSDHEGQFAPINWEIACLDAFNRKPKRGPLNTFNILLDCSTTTAEFLERVQCVVWARRLVHLELLRTQSIALAPEEAKKGDLICILYGCSVPVVLREIVDDEPVAKRQRSTPEGSSSKPSKVHYNWIGECYVHGMMGGEAFNVKRSHKDSKTFEIR